MKKKIIFLVVSLILVSGCEANYELEILQDTFTVNADLTDSYTEERFQEMSNLANEEYFATEKIKYDVKNISDNTKVGLNFKQKFNLNEFRRSSAFKSCYDTSSIITGDEYIYIVAKDYMDNCGGIDIHSEINSFSIKIKTYHKVSENNATNVNGNTYEWSMKDGKMPDIIFTYHKDKYVDGYTPPLNEPNEVDISKDNTLIVVLVIACLVVFGLLSLLFKKREEESQK